MKTMQDYELRCTAEQTRRAYKLGVPIESSQFVYPSSWENNMIKIKDEYGNYSIILHIPTTQQMIGWLQEQGFWIYVKRYWQCNTFYACLEKQGLTRIDCTDDFEKPEQAEHSAIDMVFDLLEKGGTK